MSVHQVNEKRRALIKSGLAAGAAMSIGIPVTSVQAASARKSEEGISWHKGVCRFCGTGCGLQVGVRDGRRYRRFRPIRNPHHQRFFQRRCRKVARRHRGENTGLLHRPGD